MSENWIRCAWCHDPLVEDEDILVFTYLTCRACGGKNEIVSTVTGGPRSRDGIHPPPHIARMVPSGSAPAGDLLGFIPPTLKEHEGHRRLCDLIHRGKG